jgi:cation diffusion facilitator family transporter
VTTPDTTVGSPYGDDGRDDHGRDDHDHGRDDHDHGRDDHDRDDHDRDDHDHDHDHDHEHGHAHPGGVRGFVQGLLRPHSHDAADSVDATLEASHEGMRALALSLVGLACTAVVQVVIFAFSGSVALLADTIHNFADALTAVPLAAAFWLARRPADRRYTYGYGRSEDLAGIFIVVTVLASSAVAAWEAVDRLVHPAGVHDLWWVAAAGLVGFAGNETVASYRIRVGRRIGSAALEADGYHARTDGFTSLAVVVGAAGSALGWRLADPVVGLVITVAILAVVRHAARDIYRRLMDAVDPALVDRVTAVLAGVEGIDAVDAVRIRWIGHELHVEAEVRSDGTLTLADAHRVAEHAEHHLLHEVPRLSGVVIHSSPAVAATAASGGTDDDVHRLTAHHRRDLPGPR